MKIFNENQPRKKKFFFLLNLSYSYNNKRRGKNEERKEIILICYIYTDTIKKKRKKLTESVFILNSVGDINENYVYCQDLWAIVELLYKMVQWDAKGLLE